MIKPTIGRVVWFHPNQGHSQPWAALITYVHSDTLVNLVAFTPNGLAEGQTSVPLIQEGDEAPSNYFCMWMPYQIGQAKQQEQK